jgi:hypothetical protein
MSFDEAIKLAQKSEEKLLLKVLENVQEVGISLTNKTFVEVIGLGKLLNAKGNPSEYCF